MTNGDLNVKLKIDGDAKGAVQAISTTEKGLQGLGEAGKGATTAASGVDEIGNAAQRAEKKSTTSHRQIRDGIVSISEQLSEVKNLYAAWIGIQQAGNAVSGVAATADAYANLTARIKMVVGEGAAFQTAFQGVQDIALKTNTSLDSTGKLFLKLAEAGKEMGVGQAEALRLTETVNQAIQLSGASAQASDAAVTQFIQGLQSGVLRGDEFNSIMEQSPRLAKALAEGLGVTTGELRKMAEAGQLSSQTVIGALKGQAAAVESEFGKLPQTIGRAITDLQTQWRLWIGTMDESAGASKSVAGAIEGLARNFDLVASGLINAGQAYLGWKAYNIVAEFIGLKAAVAASAAAKAVDTAATLANTTATAANTTAQIANNAAKTGAAGAAGGAAAAASKLAGALSLVKGLSFAFLLTNIVDIGKWLGEATAKAMGYGKVIADLERQERAAAKATKAMADQGAELAQKMQLAADKALGLSVHAKKLVGDFGELTKNGESTAEALGKIGKDMDLSNIKGIDTAGAALDALAVKGKISADQVRDALQKALDGKDLQVFEANARAAFDGTEQGARRLSAVLDAQLGEALRRTGLDAGALSAGVNKAAQSALNDFDVMLGRLDEMKARGVNTGIALAASLNQAGKAATTEAAAKEVTRRWEELGAAGLVTGKQLADGLEKARMKADELTPGINSLAEAFKTLGMKSPEELRKVSVEAQSAFEKIKAGSDYSAAGLSNTREAFKRMADASIAANGGVASDTLKAQAGIYGLEIKADAAGKAVIGLSERTRESGDAANGASGGHDRLAGSLEKVSSSADRAKQALKDLSYQQMVDKGMSQSEISNQLSDRQTSDAEKAAGVVKRNVSTDSIDWRSEAIKRGLSSEQAGKVVDVIGDYLTREIEQFRQSQIGAIADPTSYRIGFNGAMEQAFQRAIDYAQTTSGSAKTEVVQTSGNATPTQDGGYRIETRSQQPARTQSTTVNINLGGKTTAVNVASQGDANALAGLLKQLESESRRAL